MDLRHGAEYEDFRLEVREFLTANWPPAGSEDRFPTKDQIAEFRDGATERGYLRRGIPKKYGGSEQPADDEQDDSLLQQMLKDAAAQARGDSPRKKLAPDPLSALLASLAVACGTKSRPFLAAQAKRPSGPKRRRCYSGW